MGSRHFRSSVSGSCSNHLKGKFTITSNDFPGFKAGNQRSLPEHRISIVARTVRHYDVSTRKQSRSVGGFLPGFPDFLVLRMNAASAEARFPPSLLLCRRRSYCFNQPSHGPRVISTIWKGREMHTLAVAPEVSNESTLAG